MFTHAAALSFDLCAPALHEASYYAHYSTMRNQRCFARRTGFVEIMMPCFSRGPSNSCCPRSNSARPGGGGGWIRLAQAAGLSRHRHHRCGAGASHAPVGMFRDAELGRRVHAESDRIMEDFDCAQVHKTFAIVGPSGRRSAWHPMLSRSCSPKAGVYLLQSNPAVLPLLVQAQQPEAGWGGYPIAGTPSCAAA